MSKVELLMPAGNITKMQYAIAYGADAVYLGVVDLSLRSMKSGDVINSENIKAAIDTAHKMGAKAYATINIFPQNEDINKLSAFVELLNEAKPDAIIFSDPGVYNILKREAPEIPLHLSTQANTQNSEAVKFWRDLGVSRVILARELSLRQIEEISSKVPDIELEAFVHGSMCVSNSGRCLLSDYMTGNQRKSNHGNCAQPCRWKYYLREEKRQGQYFEIMEDNRGTYIMNAKDLCLLKYIPELINAGVSSLKVEGRTKSQYYASVVAKTYRQAIDTYYSGETVCADELVKELTLVGNRGFTTGFLIDKPDSSHIEYSTNNSMVGSAFLGAISEKIENNKYKIVARNQIKLGDEVDWITPVSQISAKITSILNADQMSVEVANTNDIIYLTLEENLERWEWGIIRGKEREKDGIQADTNIRCGSCK